MWCNGVGHTFEGGAGTCVAANGRRECECFEGRRRQKGGGLRLGTTLEREKWGCAALPISFFNFLNDMIKLFCGSGAQL